MGYYANGSGFIDFQCLLTEDQEDVVYKAAGKAMFDYDFYRRENGTRDSVDIWFDGKYRSDVYDALNDIAAKLPVTDGRIDFSGEDGEVWRFTYDKKTNTFDDETARIVYDSEQKLNWDSAPEFVGRIIDLFEDFLEEKGIDIPNEDKIQSENPAIIYGMDYGFLQSGIEDILINWDILPAHR